MLLRLSFCMHFEFRCISRSCITKQLSRILSVWETSSLAMISSTFVPVPKVLGEFFGEFVAVAKSEGS